jgi:hypothetical protein
MAGAALFLIVVAVGLSEQYCGLASTYRPHMNLMDITKKFATPEACVHFLEGMR